MVADIMSFVVENKMWFFALAPVVIILALLKFLG